MIASDIFIRPFQPTDAHVFRALNEEWIAKYFQMEEPDLLVLSDPIGQILDAGGYIFIACVGAEAVGCCALIPSDEPRTFEVAKMAVSPEQRGRGIGRAILEHTITYAKAIGCRALHLGSNSKLENAVHLYESCGFIHRPAASVPPSPYARANIFMEMRLDGNSETSKYGT